MLNLDAWKDSVIHGGGQHYLLPDGDMLLFKQAIDGPQQLFQQLLNNMPWRQEAITLFGRRVLSPRLQAWYADKGVHYSYSGLTLEGQGWPALLSNLRKDIEAIVGEPFNSTLLNRYRNGQDSMGWHSDDEPELGVNPTIVSLSLGDSRIFELQHKSKKSACLSLLLQTGDLLIMRGATQHFWRHRIAKTSKTVGERINLTFRKIISPEIPA